MTDIQEMSVRQLHKAPGEDTLWACVEAFRTKDSEPCPVFRTAII